MAGFSRMNVYRSVLELLPNIWPTPLVMLKTLSNGSFEAWAKLECFNPFSHSIKDRPVWNMIVKAIKECIECGKLYEATSGNVGIAMAAISNALGVKFRAYLPRKSPKYTRALLKILGAEVIVTDKDIIDQELIEYVKSEAIRDRALNLNQFENDNNFEVHYLYTAREIDEQLASINRSPPKALIAGIGTSGHIAAISKYFKEKYGDGVKVVGVTPAMGDSIPGIKRIETKPKWFFKEKIDKVIEVSLREAAEEVVNVARGEGLLIGLSSGAVVKAYKVVREEIGEGVYTLVFPDDIFKYVEVISELIKLD